MPGKSSQKELSEAIYQIFTYAHLADIKKMQWDLLKSWATKTYDSLDPHDRESIFILHEKLDKLLEVTAKLYKWPK